MMVINDSDICLNMVLLRNKNLLWNMHELSYASYSLSLRERVGERG
jgi:hypothetical protein